MLLRLRSLPSNLNTASRNNERRNFSLKLMYYLHLDLYLLWDCLYHKHDRHRSSGLNFMDTYVILQCNVEYIFHFCNYNQIVFISANNISINPEKYISLFCLREFMYNSVLFFSSTFIMCIWHKSLVSHSVYLIDFVPCVVDTFFLNVVQGK